MNTMNTKNKFIKTQIEQDNKVNYNKLLRLQKELNEDDLLYRLRQASY